MFGQQQQQQQQPSSGLFGSATQGPTSTGTGLFGSTTQQQPSGGGLFGAAQNPSTLTGASLFGSTQPQQQQQQQQQPSTSIFGSTTTGTQGTGTGGNLFGSTNPQQQQQQPQQQPQQGSLFGSTTTTPAQSNTGGGLFGTGTPAQGSGSNIFGNPATAQPTTGGLFGTGSGTTTGGSLFGSTTQSATNTGGGLFGSQSATSTQPTGSLFGSTTAQQPLTASIFGASTATQPQQAQSSLFGQSTGGLGGTGGGLLSSTLSASTLRTSLGSSQLNSDPGAQYAALTQRIEGIKNAWDATSPQCKFQHYFYNLVEPNQVRLYGRPANATNEVLWQKAVRENPDPTCLVPVLAVGFDDLQKRVDAQTRQATSHQEKLQELRKRIGVLAQRHELSNTSRLHRASAQQVQLTHRLLRLVQHLHLLIPTLRSSSIRPEEEALRTALEEIDDEIRRPGGMGRMRGKLNELWALIGAVKAVRERDAKGVSDGNVEWAVVDEEGLAQIAQILAEQQAGLAYLTKTLQKDLNDLAVIKGTAGPVDADAM